MATVNVFESENLFNSNINLSVEDMKKKQKYSHQTYHGNPKRLLEFLKRELEESGYSVKNDNLDLKSGGRDDEVSDVFLKIYAEKRTDVRAKTKPVVPRITLLITLFGGIFSVGGYLLSKYFSNFFFYLLFFSGIALFFGGIYLVIKGPKQKILPYFPSLNSIWVSATGEALYGSKSTESRTGGSKKAGSKKSIKTSYITSDLEVHLASQNITLEDKYREKLLIDSEKYELDFVGFIKLLADNEKEFCLESESKYSSLAENSTDATKHPSSEMERFVKKLNKFSEVD